MPANRNHPLIRYGILGFGRHAAKRLAPSFVGAANSVLSGLWRRSPEQARAAAQEFHIPNVFATAEELCASSEIDAVFVASPDAMHLPHVLLALRAGKAVLCEKPLGMNAAEVEEMLGAASESGSLFGVAQNFRYNRSVQLIVHWIAQGRIGKPALAHAQFCYDAGKAARSWIYDPHLACGGPIGDVGIHCIDALRFVLAEEILSVTTMGSGDPESGALESRAAIGLEFQSGSIGCVTVTTRAAYRTLIEVVGSDGAIVSENGLTVDHPVEVILRQGGAIVDRETVSNADGYTLMLDAFSSAAGGKGDFASPGVDGLRNQIVLDAAYASLRQGCRVTVPGRI